MEKVTSYRTYWSIWGMLLALTLIMIVLEAAGFPRVFTILVLVGAMMTKATLIAGWFMHLRFERVALVLAVVVGTLATAALLFFLLIPDGLSILQSAPR